MKKWLFLSNTLTNQLLVLETRGNTWWQRTVTCQRNQHCFVWRDKILKVMQSKSIGTVWGLSHLMLHVLFFAALRVTICLIFESFHRIPTVLLNKAAGDKCPSQQQTNKQTNKQSSSNVSIYWDSFQLCLLPWTLTPSRLIRELNTSLTCTDTHS